MPAKELSPKMMQLFTSVIKHADLGPADWDAIALECGYKDKNNAKTVFSRVRKSLIEDANNAASKDTASSSASANANASSPAKTPVKRKRTATAKAAERDGGDDGSEDDEEVAAPKGKKGKKAASAGGGSVGGTGEVDGREAIKAEDEEAF